MISRKQLPAAYTYKGNAFALAFEHIFAKVADVFASTSITLPALINQLTGSAPLVGLVGTVNTASWLVPQVFAANYITSKSLKKPFVVWTGAIGRPAFFLIALWLVLGGYRNVTLTVVFLLASIVLFQGMDGLGAAGWFDILTKSIPATRRGRVIGSAQVIGSLLGLGASVVVHYFLSEQGPRFPNNYAAVLAFASAISMISWAAFLFVREPSGHVQKYATPWRYYFPQLGQIWKQDRDFARVVTVGILVGGGGMAGPFYVVFARHQLGLPLSAIGWFLAAERMGSLVGGIVFGLLNDWKGSQRVVQMASLLALFAPAFALILSLVSIESYLSLLVALVFAALGMIGSSNTLGYRNYVLEIAPEKMRPVYIALANTLRGSLMIAPLIGGWVLEQTSYTVLFMIATTVAGLGFLLSLRLSVTHR